VREWWGQQYKYLFDVGLEMVWQDMTTPAVRNTRGDMCSFPFKLLLSDDFDHIYDPNPHGVQTTSPLSPAIKIWNLYSYNLHKATYEGLNRLPGRDNKRNFIIGRGSSRALRASPDCGRATTPPAGSSGRSASRRCSP
jgi:alpha-glucosidase